MTRFKNFSRKNCVSKSVTDNKIKRNPLNPTIDLEQKEKFAH